MLDDNVRSSNWIRQHHDVGVGDDLLNTCFTSPQISQPCNYHVNLIYSQLSNTRVQDEDGERALTTQPMLHSFPQLGAKS